MPIQTCFESEQELLIFQKLSMKLGGESPKREGVDFNRWLRSHFPQILSPEDRLKIARAFTQAKFPAEEWLPAIELLRGSLVLNKEQVIFCFNQLPKTLKNKALRDCFYFYLESGLADDTLSKVWTLIGELKSQSKTLSFLKEITFVPSTEPSYLFKELCEAIAYLPQESEVSVEPFQNLFGKGLSPQQPSVHQGQRLTGLEALALAISQYLSAHSDQSVFLRFLGSSRSKHFLKCRLASLGYFSEDWIQPPPLKEKDPYTLLVKKLRRNTRLSSHEKWLLNSILNTHRPYFHELLPTYLNRLLSQSLLKQEQKEFLETLGDDSWERPLAPGSVYFTPWISIPPLPGFGHFAFCDESFTEHPPSSPLLSENELEALFYAGFQLPRKSQMLKARKELLRQYAGYWPSHTFTSLCPEDLTGFHIESLPAFKPRIRPQLTSPQADLPIQRLSATQLETYADCPSKYLFRRLKLKEPSLPLSEFALQLGQAVHRTLETLLNPSSLNGLEETSLRDTFLEALKETLPPSESSTSRRLFYLKAFEKFIPRILQNESLLKTVFRSEKTLAVEKEFSLSLNGIPVIGKIDRVDLLENGQLLVLDYKTGSVDFTPDHLAQGTNFQALLYWLGAEEAFNLSPAAMLFYDLKKGEVKRGLAKEESLSLEAKKALTRGHTLKDEKLKLLIDSGLGQIESLAQSIRSGDFAPKPSSEACRFCEAPAFCREGQGYV